MNAVWSTTEEQEMITAQRQKIVHPSFSQTKSSASCHWPTNSPKKDTFAISSDGEVLIFRKSGLLIRRISVSFHIRKLLWVEFNCLPSNNANGQTQNFLTVVGDYQIFFFSELDGHSFDHDIPFKIRDVYSTSYGLIIERSWSSEEEYLKDAVDFVYLYSLAHPLDEIMPIIYRMKDIPVRWWFCWEMEEMSVVCGTDDCLLVFDRKTNVHRLFKIKRSSKNETRSAARMKQKHEETRKMFGQLSTPLASSCTPQSQLKNLIVRPLSIQTRSMMRLTGAKGFAADSPGIGSVNSPYLDMSHLSLRARGYSLGSNTNVHISRMLEREPENEMMLADLCLECIWSEPHKKEESLPAIKGFISRSLINQIYLNYVSFAGEYLRCIRLTDRKDGGPLATVGTVSTIPCLDAVCVKNEGTIVLEVSGSLALYSGSCRIGLIVTPNDQVPRNMRLFENVGSSVVLTENFKEWYRIDLPTLCEEKLAREMITVVLDGLPIDKSNKLAASWRVRTCAPLSNAGPRINPELHELLRFLLHISGISVFNHPFISTNSPVEDVNDTTIDAKLRRPKKSTAELYEHFLANEPRANELDTYGRPLGNIKLTVDPSKEFYECIQLIMVSVHAKLNEWNLFVQTKHAVNISMYYVHVMSLSIDNQTIRASCETQCGIPPFEHHVDFIGMEDAPTKKCEKPFLLDDVLRTYFVDNAELSMYPTNTLVPKANRILLGIAVGLGRIDNLPDLAKLFGKNWAKKLRLTSAMQNDVMNIINASSKRRSLRCAEILKLFEFSSYELALLNHTVGLTLGYIIAGDHAASNVLFGKLKRPVAVPCRSELDKIARLRWPLDRRLCNAEQMLDSSQPVLINMQFLSNVLSPSSTDQDIREAQETFLSGTCIRYLVQSFGRAMLDFRTEAPLPTETYTVPDLCLSARLYPLNVVFEIPMNEVIKPYRDWGEFYNGVAAGLRVGHSSEVALDNEWLIRMTKDTNDEGVPLPDSTPTCGGLLFGFGLNNQLKKMNMYHIHDVLTQLEEFTSVGLLLGYAASNVGTSDYKIHKILSTQLPFLMGQTMISLTIPPQVQAAALAAIGLLYAGSGQYNLATKIVNEIGKSAPPEESPSPDRPAYKLSAGFAAGLICLGKGVDLLNSDPPFQNAQPSLIKRLSALLVGGHRSHCVYPCNTAKQEQNPFMENHAVSEISGPSSHVFESECVNVHMTSHPACIALGLMFLKSGNQEIAQKLELPDTLTDLERIRPDIILSRVICRNLIMWDDIKPDRKWIEDQVPKVIKKYMPYAFNWGRPNSHETLIEPKIDLNLATLMDRQLYSEVYYYTCAGACFALALRYCTARDKEKNEVFKILEEFCRQVYPQVAPKDYRSMRNCADQNAISLCLSTLVLSMSLVCVGSGNVRSVQYSRYLRIYDDVLQWVRSGRKHYEQLTAHMAIGLQFLGRGRYGFKDDSLSIALMVISMYPLPAHHIADNRYYHQPLRFLWTMATEPRLLTPVCMPSGEVVVVKVRIVHQDGEVEITSGPVLLPPLHVLKTVEVAYEEDIHQPVMFDLSRKEVVNELTEILHLRNGRVPVYVMTSKTSGGPSSYVLPTMEGLLRGVYSDIPSSLRIPGTYRMVDPILSSDPARSIRWDEIEIIPNMRMHLISLQRDVLDGGNSHLGHTLQLMRAAGQHRIEQQILTELDKGFFPNMSLYDMNEPVAGTSTSTESTTEVEPWYEKTHFNSPPIFIP